VKRGVSLLILNQLTGYWWKISVKRIDSKALMNSRERLASSTEANHHRSSYNLDLHLLPSLDTKRLKNFRRKLDETTGRCPKRCCETIFVREGLKDEERVTWRVAFIAGECHR
jgi:hypothetical protein